MTTLKEADKTALHYVDQLEGLVNDFLPNSDWEFKHEQIQNLRKVLAQGTLILDILKNDKQSVDVLREVFKLEEDEEMPTPEDDQKLKVNLYLNFSF